MKRYLILLLSVALFAACNDTKETDDHKTPKQTISLNAEAIEFDVDGDAFAGVSSITATSSADWRLVGDTSWCTPSVTKGVNGTTVTFTAAAVRKRIPIPVSGCWKSPNVSLRNTEVIAGITGCPMPSNGTCNKILKKIAGQYGIKTRLAYHVSRHTFSTLITLSQGVPIETVSKILGIPISRLPRFTPK